jgi:hypothetical protein
MNLDELLSPLGGRLALLAMLLAVVGFGFLALAGSWLLDFARKKASLKPLRSLFALVLAVAFLASAAAAAFLSTSLRTYDVFTERTLVARIECERITDNPDYQLLLRYTPSGGGQEGEPSHYLLKGDMWEVGGDILKWDPQLTLLGIHTSQKVTRISSHVMNADEEPDADSSYRLNGGTDQLWMWLHEYGDQLPFVEAVYGSAVFTLPSSRQAFELYIGQDGYSLKKVSRKGS